ncbi:MAG: GGDEF domain-containing protein [Candidatus Competibacteraceae bacterium]|uniref:diguanylate cyclase n=1 Tax=Candidatus Contendobacter odensis Run_B_J11 TaxID=1400861 RepID=A0A7U7J472_9GAMM|nr:sensor domain-containing diguanylate cyclase [Candidatus Contendobacter odensis]MBK8534642.1 GGDEF domain-containing protein [Candidatus Competibacteraceae bacterium]CDH45320.1 GGDEF domain protein [Candidatus Contendobacter odensis Run_B_J11]
MSALEVPQKFSGISWFTRKYAGGLEAIFALIPALAIAYIHQFQDPTLRFVSAEFHEVAIGAAILVAVFITVVTWKCYQFSGEPFLRWLTLGFLSFVFVYAPHGVLTRFSHDNIWLFLLYGPASRLVMSGLFLISLLHYDASSHPPQRRSNRTLVVWGTAFLVVDAAIALVATSPFASHPWVRLSMEFGALSFSLAGIFIMLARHIGSPLMKLFLFALSGFALSSLSFLLAKPWNHQWWLAHAIFAAGFFLLSYGVLQAFHTTHAFSKVFSQEEMMRQLAVAKGEAENALERLQFANIELERLAATDSLTSASNRRHFMARTQAEMANARRSGASLSILALDLDHFKDVNDHFGHPAGDVVLQALVIKIIESLRPLDVVGRMGGEEFTVLLPQTNYENALEVAERIRERVEAMRVPVDSHDLQITVSIGVAQFDLDDNTPNDVFKQADDRLYRAKQSGRNRVVGAAVSVGQPTDCRTQVR